jgi:phytanoyl-CoA hydroxylase
MSLALNPEQIAQKLYRYDRIHQPIASPADLNESHVEQYHRQGFLAVEKVFSTEEIEEYSRAITDVVAEGDPKIVSFEAAAEGRALTPAERERYVRKCMWFVEREPRLKAMSQHKTLVSIVEKLIGNPVKLIQDMALLKPPHIGSEKPWHQDSAYFAIAPANLVMGTWTALDPATIENGCMHVIPGSHLGGPKPHYHDRDCQLNDEDVQVEQDLVVPLSPGGVLFFSSLLHHGTPPNQSATRRRAIQLHYCSVTCESIDDPRHLQMFQDAVGYAGCLNRANGLKPRPIVEKPAKI